ncbi:MAG: hypothetical protein Q7K57_61285 [Burkholderiaceae bacterium]|nr:hypothetical protein [Burkholderiaceae bacterium]
MSAVAEAVSVAEQSMHRNAGRWGLLKAKYSSAEISAISHLYEFAKRNTYSSSGKAAIRLLVGLYNGNRFQFDLTDLRLFDRQNLDAAMATLRLDAERTRCEVHDLLDAIYSDGYSTQADFEQWAFDHKLKGRCKKEHLPDPLRRRRVEL